MSEQTARDLAARATGAARALLAVAERSLLSSASIERRFRSVAEPALAKRFRFSARAGQTARCAVDGADPARSTRARPRPACQECQARSRECRGSARSDARPVGPADRLSETRTVRRADATADSQASKDRSPQLLAGRYRFARVRHRRTFRAFHERQCETQAAPPVGLRSRQGPPDRCVPAARCLTTRLREPACGRAARQGCRASAVRYQAPWRPARDLAAESTVPVGELRSNG